MNYSDGDFHDVKYWDNNGMEGLSDTTPSSVTDTSWLTEAGNILQSAAQAYAAKEQTAAAQAQTAAKAATASSPLSASNLMLYGALGVGAILLISLMSKKRR